jgi:hypothetical protein
MQSILDTAMSLPCRSQPGPDDPSRCVRAWQAGDGPVVLATRRGPGDRFHSGSAKSRRGELSCFQVAASEWPRQVRE